MKMYILPVKIFDPMNGRIVQYPLPHFGQRVLLGLDPIVQVIVHVTVQWLPLLPTSHLHLGPLINSYPQ